MSRWLDAATRATSPANETNKAPPAAPKLMVASPHECVLLELSVLSEGITDFQANGIASIQDHILAAINGGNRTPGAIATTTELGATATYQELDRMVLAEVLSTSCNGSYCHRKTMPE